MIETVKEVLMRRDENTSEEADARIEEFKSDLEELLNDLDKGHVMTLLSAEELVKDHFSLEPDYLEEFLWN